MTVEKAIQELFKLPPDAELYVASLSHGGSVPVQGFVDLDEGSSEHSLHWVEVIACDDEERERYGLKPL